MLQRFGLNKPLSGLRKTVIEFHSITDGCLKKYKIREEIINAGNWGTNHLINK